MKLSVRVLLLGLLMGLGLLAQAKNFVELNPPRPTEDPTKVEVIEFFWYGCPHCYRFDPYLEAWRKKQPDQVLFKRQPVIFGPHWAPQARAYFTAEVLGVVDKIHRDFFDAMHQEKKRMAGEEELAKFFAEHGIDEQTFKNAFHSFASGRGGGPGIRDHRGAFPGCQRQVSHYRARRRRFRRDDPSPGTVGFPGA